MFPGRASRTAMKYRRNAQFTLEGKRPQKTKCGARLTHEYGLEISPGGNSSKVNRSPGFDYPARRPGLYRKHGYSVQKGRLGGEATTPARAKAALPGRKGGASVAPVFSALDRVGAARVVALLNTLYFARTKPVRMYCTSCLCPLNSKCTFQTYTPLPANCPFASFMSQTR